MPLNILLPLLFLVLGSYQLRAQSYFEAATQHRFAQTYVGLNTQVVPSSGKLFWKDQSAAFPAMAIPRLTIGGLHFWGRLDFKMSLSLARFGNFDLDETTTLVFRPGGDFSARYYPWQIRNKRVRPFIGVAFNQMFLGLEDSQRGERIDFHASASAVSGVSLAFRGWQLNAEVMYLPFSRRDFYLNPHTKSTFELPPIYGSIGLVKYFDATIKEEAPKESGETARIAESLKTVRKLNTFSIGIAPSAAYFLQAPQYSTVPRSSLPRHKVELTWDFGIGYLFNNANLHLGVSYRNYTSGVESYGLEHLVRRSSFALEGYKFLFDYHGFVPFIGPSISYERWATAEFVGDTQIGEVQRTRAIAPGLIFGWDILPSPLETWILRTNLRYYPLQKINNLADDQSRVDQFEFNFIQLVIYPNRMRQVPKARKRDRELLID